MNLNEQNPAQGESPSGSGTWILNLVLLGTFVLLTGLTWGLINRTDSRWLIDFFGIVGTIASILGVVYAVIQLSLIREEAEIISRTSKETKKQVLNLGELVDVAAAIRRIQEVKGLLRHGRREVALLRLEDVKETVLGLNQLEYEPSGFDRGLILRQLRTLSNSIEKDLLYKTKELLVEKANQELESIIETLGTMQRKQIHGS